MQSSLATLLQRKLQGINLSEELELISRKESKLPATTRHLIVGLAHIATQHEQETNNSKDN
jgi:hypothetical protein